MSPNASSSISTVPRGGKASQKPAGGKSRYESRGSIRKAPWSTMWQSSSTSSSERSSCGTSRESPYMTAASINRVEQIWTSSSINGHAWSKDLHFPTTREVHFYEGDVWDAIRGATQGEPLAVWLLGRGDKSLKVD